jgi:hypothetical protein
MVTTPSHGDLNWDGTLNAALNDLQAQVTAATNRANALAVPTPADYSMAVWNFDFRMANGQSTATAGQLLMARVALLSTTTINNIVVGIQTAGATLTAGQNLVGLYNDSGSLVGQSADQSGNWTSAGRKVMALTSPYNAPAGVYHVALLANGTTPPQFVRSIGSSALPDFANMGLSPAAALWATGGTGLTALPSNVTMSARTQNAMCFWVGLS